MRDAAVSSCWLNGMRSSFPFLPHHIAAAGERAARRHTSTTSSTPGVLMKPLTNVSGFWNRIASGMPTQLYQNIARLG